MLRVVSCVDDDDVPAFEPEQAKLKSEEREEVLRS